jgi:alkylhydroperoxidase family enzyme
MPYPEKLNAELKAALDKNANLNVSRMMAHSPAVFEGFGRMGWAILRKSKLDPALRELAILRVGVNCASAYEWGQHVDLARAVGTREAAITAARSGEFSALTPLERLAVEFADQICNRARVEAATFERARSFLDAEELVELTMACGFYLMTAAFLNSFDIEMETDVRPLGEVVASGLARPGGGAG